MSMTDDTDKRMTDTEKSAAGPAIILIFGAPLLGLLLANFLASLL
jgi:hypothetical protein